jgi:aspartyl-tRNA(Asn)/glutamyl-tRNA(Gln) amidotransferase subunit C
MKQSIDQGLIKHIARLSRIELNETQTLSLSQQFKEIISYFDKLNELDTENISPLTQAVELHNVLAVDTPRTSLPTEAALANAPAQDKHFFKVPKVLGDSQ